MITTNDINKLKKVFANKTDLKEALSNYPTKEDAKKYATLNSIDDVIEGIHTIIEMIGEIRMTFLLRLTI